MDKTSPQSINGISIGDTVVVTTKNWRVRSWSPLTGIVTRFFEYGLFVREGIQSKAFSWQANTIVKMIKPKGDTSNG